MLSLEILISRSSGNFESGISRRLKICATNSWVIDNSLPDSPSLKSCSTSTVCSLPGSKRPVLVEGFFDCLKLHQAGIPAVALMGAALYPSQQRALLDHFRSVILMLDGDTAGRCATARMAAQLRPYVSLGVIHLPDGVQPDQLTTEAVREIWQAHRGYPA